jgi:phenylpropionate dioxygenase-like ring-hydroxylating dioxygenase large terminal subunit
MKQQDIDNLRLLMEYAAARTEPPRAFSSLHEFARHSRRSIRRSAFFQLEKKYLWRRSWLFAAHIDEVPEPGPFLLGENTGELIIIVHTVDGSINPFYNTCRHQDAPVITDQSGKNVRLTCRYHGWSYALNGGLVTGRDPEDLGDLGFSCGSLNALRYERFGNLIFVNFDENAPSLLDWLGPVADELKEFQFENYKFISRKSFDLKCQWKIAMEANTEVYHVKLIHATTVGPSLDDRRNVNTFYATVMDEWLHRAQCSRKNAITDPSDCPRLLKPWVKLHLVLRYLPELGITFRRQYPATTAVLTNQHHPHQV